MKEQTATKKRIAFVSPNAWTMYNFRKELLQSILQAGFEVVIIAERDKFVTPLELMGCLFVPITINNRSLRITDDILLYLRLLKIYKNYRPHFIFHYVVKPNIYGTLAARSLKIPSVAIVTGLGHAFNKNNLLKTIIKILFHFSLRHAYEVWCLNTEDATYLINHKMADARKVKILPGEGVNTNLFKKTALAANEKEPFHFLMSARLLKSKGVIEYAEATMLLRQKYGHVRCLLLGAIEDHPDAISQELILQWQNGNGLQYIGFTNNIKANLEQADCFIYPSYYNEGVPRSLLEACSMKLPIITTDNTGCRNLIIDGINGLLCNKQDPADLASKMEAMLQIPIGRRNIMGAEGRRIVEENFSVDKVIPFYTDLLENFFKNR